MSARTWGRRDAIGLLGALAWLGCGAARPAAPVPPPEPLLHLDPLVDLVPAPGLVWLVEAWPRALLAAPGLPDAIAIVVPAARFDRFAAAHGGVDLRLCESLVVAQYEAATLALAKTPLDPARIEAAFTAHATSVEGRMAEGGVTRLWAGAGSAREQVAIFGRRVVGVERGPAGPLRPAEYFARGKLRRASPALRSDPLAAAAELVGPAPLRAFAPGPFEGAWSSGLGGLLRASTAVAATMHPATRPAGPALEVQLALAGAWGADGPAAAQRLAAAFELLASEGTGRLLGLDRPLEEPRVTGDAQALRLQVTLDALALARGLHAATDARIDEIMAY